MLTNDILRRVRYALDINDAKAIEIFALAGHTADKKLMDSIFTKDDDPKFSLCPDRVARLFFQGLVISKRGKKDDADNGKAKKETGGEALTNNDVLWYLRIAMQLKDEDIVAIMKKVSVEVGKSEINALFRKKDHQNYRPCGDQFMRNFLAGFTATFRP